MRLLNVHTFEFQQFEANPPPPPYAILSHRWSRSEPKLADIERWRGHPPERHAKVYGFAQWVRAHLPDIEWIWVDSCCINQDSAAELSEGVNRMFAWYRDARICLAYLPDVEHPSDRVALRRSVWFKRGWTLQELVASTVVLFLTNDWQVIGHKGLVSHLGGNIDPGPNIEALLSEVTRIPQAVLQDYSNSRGLSFSAKMRWMEGRETQKEEDMVYAVFGIFDVTPGANYGEGKHQAELRLKEAMQRGQSLGADDTFNDPSPSPMPFPRDPAFVDRKEMDEIQRKLSKPGARIALTGLGGIGKSQLAIEHCYRAIEEQKSMWILWIHASSAARFDQDLRRLANDLAITDRQETDAHTYQLVRNWLNQPRRLWLIVIDNADDADFLFDPPEASSKPTSTMPRIGYFPVCSSGSLLVTTRRKTIATQIADDSNIVELQTNEEHAIELLRRKLGKTEVTAHLGKLANALEYMPLAVSQAAAYIKARMPRCTVEDYLAKLERSDNMKSALLKVESSELRRDREEAKNSILQTWQISFEHIRDTRESAANLLSLMSFYDHQGIPDFLIRPDAAKAAPELNNGAARSRDISSDNQDDGNDDESHNSRDHIDAVVDGDDDYYDDEEEEDEDGAEVLAFEDDVHMLRDYSFVSTTSSKSILEMHSLVQLATQCWLKEKKQHQQWELMSLQNLAKMHPGPEYGQWEMCRSLFPHATLALKSRIKDRNGLISLGAVLFKASAYAREQGAYTDSEAMAQRSVHISTSLYGNEHRTTLRDMSNLASTYWKQGRWGKSEELEVKVLEISRRVLGAEHPDTLMNMGNLASTYWNQGRWKEAEELEVKVLETSRRVLGAEHPDTTRSMANLAVTYFDLGRCKEAEELEVKVLELNRRVLGAEHPHTLRSMSSLAVTYQSQGLRRQDEELKLKVLELDKRVLGPEHPDTLTSMANLATSYYDQDRLQEAMGLMKECVRLQTAVLGATHPNTLNSTKWLKVISNRLDEADRDEMESAVADLSIDDRGET